MKAYIYKDKKDKNELDKYQIIVESEDDIETLAMDALRLKEANGYCTIQVDVMGIGIFERYKEGGK